MVAEGRWRGQASCASGWHLAAGEGECEAEGAEEDEVAGEQFEIAFADTWDFRGESIAEGGAPEIGAADDAVEDVEDEQGGGDESGAGVGAECGEEAEHDALVAESGDEGEDEDGADDPAFREGPAEDVRDEVFDFADDCGGEAECEDAADRALGAGVGGGAEHDRCAEGEEEGLEELDGAAFEWCGGFVRQPCGEEDGDGARANQRDPHEGAGKR